MYTSVTSIIAVIIALAHITAATPPACLLAALQAQPNPADLTVLCGTLQDQFASNITEKCAGSASSSAMNIYSSTCLAKGVTISITSSASSSSKTAASSSATTTSHGFSSGSSSISSAGSSSSTERSGSSGSSKTTGSSTATGSASTASSTSQSAGSIISAHSAMLLASVVLGCGFASQLLL